jgi:Na+-transporting NADH:ubiquinone oxidoreductase subunit NqrC
MRVPRTWAIAMTILVLCLIASIVIALVKLT